MILNNEKLIAVLSKFVIICETNQQDIRNHLAVVNTYGFSLKACLDHAEKGRIFALNSIRDLESEYGLHTKIEPPIKKGRGPDKKPREVKPNLNTKRFASFYASLNKQTFQNEVHYVRYIVRKIHEYMKGIQFTDAELFRFTGLHDIDFKVLNACYGPKCEKIATYQKIQDDLAIDMKRAATIHKKALEAINKLCQENGVTLKNPLKP